MLHIQSFVFNAFQENTYVIYNEQGQCWIVDPGMYDSNELSYFFNYISDNRLKPQAIINTHTHLDHIFGVNAVVEKYNIPFRIHELDKPVLNGAAGSAMLFGFDFKDIPQPDSFIEANVGLQLGDDTLDVLLVPGHSPGSIAFHHAAGGWVIAGDALFNGSIGRTDLPGGNHAQLINSIKTELFALPEKTIVLSGHGPETTVGNEKRTNPFLT